LKHNNNFIFFKCISIIFFPGTTLDNSHEILNIKEENLIYLAHNFFKIILPKRTALLLLWLYDLKTDQMNILSQLVINISKKNISSSTWPSMVIVTWGWKKFPTEAMGPESLGISILGPGLKPGKFIFGPWPATKRNNS
jgi:hypothetical protein